MVTSVASPQETTATSWDLIRAAAGGERGAQDRFVLRYGPVVQAFLASRLRNRAGFLEAGDAFQEVFLECLKANGALEKAAPRRAGGFRAFLFGITRNVCARLEERRARRDSIDSLETVEAPEALGTQEDAVRAFDRAWAVTTMRVVRDEHAAYAATRGPAAERRVELLRLRFQEGLPIREIAQLWNEDAAKLHRDYLTARREFTGILRRVVAEEMGEADDQEIAHECRRLLETLGSD